MVANLPGWRRRKQTNKMEIMRFLAPPGSVCKRLFLLIKVSILDVKSLVEHNGEGLKSWKCTVFEIFMFK